MKLNNIKNKIKNVLQLRLFRSTNLLTYVEAKDMLKEDANGILLDVRSIQEYKEYHLNGAICIPLYELQIKIENIVQNKQQLIIVYCQSGARSKKGVGVLKAMGYTNLYEIDGGIDNI
ncbi:MAG: rhodanese-like domain-containing protein [Clostridia bacterium]|nr:rhodanese-like domain-containing protein [Clostridia bacterium]